MCVCVCVCLCARTPADNVVVQLMVSFRRADEEEEAEDEGLEGDAKRGITYQVLHHTHTRTHTNTLTTACSY